MILPATAENIALASPAIRAGLLVGLPTETVYGVAANALDPEAVLATFAAKGRPADNPLIVHLASVEDIGRVAAEFPPLARTLAERFWPGPLTIVLPKAPNVPDVTTGGLATVAVRVPAHPVARAVIAQAGVPVSAPSANLFMGLSPTRAENIDPVLAERLAMVLDGGPCDIGLESTVIDLSGSEPRLLRPGGVSAGELEAVLGRPLVGPASGERRSPGMYPRHYAPRTPLVIVPELDPDDAGIALGPPPSPLKPQTSNLHFQASNLIYLPAEPAGYAAGLYAALHALDRLGLPAIAVEAPPETPAWAAVWDRLRRAAS